MRGKCLWGSVDAKDKGMGQGNIEEEKLMGK